jgi:predicted  nucleic acid-binding Zn-ribbon protein
MAKVLGFIDPKEREIAELKEALGTITSYVKELELKFNHVLEEYQHLHDKYETLKSVTNE